MKINEIEGIIFRFSTHKLMFKVNDHLKNKNFAARGHLLATRNIPLEKQKIFTLRQEQNPHGIK